MDSHDDPALRKFEIQSRTGRTYTGLDLESNKKVSIKYVPTPFSATYYAHTYKKITLMQTLCEHKNFLCLYDVIPSQSNPSDIYLVYEHMGM